MEREKELTSAIPWCRGGRVRYNSLLLPLAAPSCGADDGDGGDGGVARCGGRRGGAAAATESSVGTKS